MVLMDDEVFHFLLNKMTQLKIQDNMYQPLPTSKEPLQTNPTIIWTTFLYVYVLLLLLDIAEGNLICSLMFGFYSPVEVGIEMG